MIEENTRATEQGLIAGLITYPEVIDSVSTIVTPESFEDAVHAEMFQVLLDCSEITSDPNVVLREMSKYGLIRKYGSKGFAELLSQTPTSGAVGYHAQETQRFYRLRQMADLVESLNTDVSNPVSDPSEIRERVESAVLGLTQDNSIPVEPIEESFKRIAIEAEMRVSANETSTSIRTGFSEVDSVTGGMWPGEMIVLGARTSIGKTSLAMQIAWNAAVAGASTLVVSLEMSEAQLVHRYAAYLEDIPIALLRDETMTQAQWKSFKQMHETYAGTKLATTVARSATMQRIRSIVRSEVLRNNTKLVVIDYLQLISPRDVKRSKYEQITEISSDIKSLAMDLNITILALSQLNRQGNENEMPMLSNLRESGAIEQDADGVWLLHRERSSDSASLIVAKNRQGERKLCSLLFDGDRCCFRDLSENY